MMFSEPRTLCSYCGRDCHCSGVVMVVRIERPEGFDRLFDPPPDGPHWREQAWSTARRVESVNDVALPTPRWRNYQARLM